MATYSFLDVSATIAGPTGSADLGMGAGTTEEGITIQTTAERDKMDIGADGSVMHSLSADRSGSVTVRLLKTSPVNAQLMAQFDLQSASPSLWGANVITVRNIQSGDVIVCADCAFKKMPDITQSKNGKPIEWEFNAGRIAPILGTY